MIATMERCDVKKKNPPKKQVDIWTHLKYKVNVMCTVRRGTLWLQNSWEENHKREETTQRAPHRGSDNLILQH